MNDPDEPLDPDLVAEVDAISVPIAEAMADPAPASAPMQAVRNMVTGVDLGKGRDKTATVHMTVGKDGKPRPYGDQEVVHIDPDLARPWRWVKPGVRAVWLSKRGRQRRLVQVQGWIGQRRVVVQTPDGSEFKVHPGTLHEWTDDNAPLLQTVAQPEMRAPTDAEDPVRVNPKNVKRVVVKVQGKLRYDGPVNKKASEMLTLVAGHGRRMVVTLHMNDGTKQRYRGNGNRLI